jgi:large conductance mechanosensitive channel
MKLYLYCRICGISSEKNILYNDYGMYLNTKRKILYGGFPPGVSKVSMLKEFMDFLYEYKIIGLAIAFVMGVAATALVKSLVDNIIMPVITFMIPGGAWKTATLTVGPIVFGWGPFLSDLIYFVIVAIVIFLIAKKVLREDKVAKK